MAILPALPPLSVGSRWTGVLLWALGFSHPLRVCIGVYHSDSPRGDPQAHRKVIGRLLAGRLHCRCRVDFELPPILFIISNSRFLIASIPGKRHKLTRRTLLRFILRCAGTVLAIDDIEMINGDSRHAIIPTPLITWLVCDTTLVGARASSTMANMAAAPVLLFDNNL